MSIRRRAFAAAAMLAMGYAGMAGTLPASAATPACDGQCISVFSKELGTNAQPNFVEDIFGGAAQVDQPVGLKRASGSDPSEDIIPHAAPVSAWYTNGMVSAAANAHYGTLLGVQQEYAPLGRPTGLCVGVAAVAQGVGLTLQPCDVPGTTVWVIDTADSPATAPDRYFPIVNAATTEFAHPFAMSYPRHVDTTELLPQMVVRRLRFKGRAHTLADDQLWGTWRGAL
jgi:hypothetical protein